MWAMCTCEACLISLRPTQRSSSVEAWCKMGRRVAGLPSANTAEDTESGVKQPFA